MTTRAGLTAIALAFASLNAFAANCGHDIHGSPRLEETKLAPNNSVITYFSPATIVMDDPTDPRHRAFGECRGQAVVLDGVARWQGGCIWKTSDTDVSWIVWSAKPGDTGTEKRDALHGTGVWHGTGKMQFLEGKTGRWSGLANGGSYFCDN